MPQHRSQHPTKPPRYLADYYCNSSFNLPSPMSTRCAYPISSVINYSRLSPQHCRFTLSLSTEHEPHSYQEANKYQCWQQAMKAEVEALELNKTWEIVDLPSHAKPIGCKWVYKFKRRPDGSVERYKARLVAKDYA